MIRRSFFYSFVEKSAGLVLALLTMAIVSRLLTPTEVGLFMVASSLVILIEAFRDFGLGSFLIQERNLTLGVTRSATTLIGLMSLILGLCVYLGSGVTATFYGEPELGELMRLAAFAFLFAPISNPLLALLRRDMNFRAVAWIGIASGMANATTTIALAFSGLGAISFVWGSLLAAIVGAVGALIARPDWGIFRPSLLYWRKVIPFGAWTTVATLVSMIYDALPRLMLGRVMSFGAVGLLSRAISLTQMPDKLFLSAVPPVVLPAMSAKLRAGESLAEPYLRGLDIITAIHWPALAFLAVMADPIVQLLLGPQWLEVIPLVQITAVAGMLLSPTYLAFAVLVSLGRVQQMALISLAALPASMAIIFVATGYGLAAVAWSLVPANAVQVAPSLVYTRRLLGFTWAELGTVALRSAALTACTAILPTLVILAQGSALGLVGLFMAVLGAVAGWGLGLALIAHPLFMEICTFWAEQRPFIDRARNDAR